MSSNFRKPLSETGGAIIELNAVPNRVTVPEVVDALFQEFDYEGQRQPISVIFDERKAKPQSRFRIPKLLARHEK